MPQEDVHVALTLDWVGRHDDYGWIETSQPSADAVAQLFHGLRLLYLEALEMPDRPVRHQVGIRSPWFRTYSDWRSFFARYGPTWGEIPPVRKWPSPLPTPPPLGNLDLRVESLAMASPLEIVLAIPREALAPLGIVGIWKFVAALEKVWHTKKRIRLEGIELDRKISEEELARDIAQQRYEDFVYGGFELQAGTVQFPEDWDWPNDRSEDL